MAHTAILVTGGAGYIAAPSVFSLLKNNFQVIVVDKKPLSYTSTGYGAEMLAQGKLVAFQGDYGDQELLRKVAQTYPLVACMHFGAFIEVGGSVTAPADYYDNNVIKTITLINALRAANITRFIFSSSCAVYGVPQGPLTEDHPRNPISPYGRTKMIIEMVLEDYAHAYGLQYAILRYFNAAGGIPEHNLYEAHEPESHLIPRILQAARESSPITIFGNDYPTPDGTCIRDYVHIADLAQAHYQALCYLLATTASITCNIGTGLGHSVEEIITTIEAVTHKKIIRHYAGRRQGDPAQLLATSNKARELLQWQPQYSTLRHIIESAYAPSLEKRYEASNNMVCNTLTSHSSDVKS